jgi:hypothetical protein
MRPKAQAVADALGRHPKLTLGKVLHCIKTRIFKTETADFMHAVAIGALHVGWGYGDTKEDRDDKQCLSCRQQNETIEHLFMCPAYKTIRRWTTKAMYAATGEQLVGKTLASYMAFGSSTDLLYKRSAVAIREVAMETLRQARNARMKSDVVRPLSPDILGKALRQRIRDDYWHARGGNEYGGYLAEGNRWHPDAYIPATMKRFNEEWRPIAAATDTGRLSLNMTELGLLRQTGGTTGDI